MQIWYARAVINYCNKESKSRVKSRVQERGGERGERERYRGRETK
jgi:hypothetical protein